MQQPRSELPSHQTYGNRSRILSRPASSLCPATPNIAQQTVPAIAITSNRTRQSPRAAAIPGPKHNAKATSPAQTDPPSANRYALSGNGTHTLTQAPHPANTSNKLKPSTPTTNPAAHPKRHAVATATSPNCPPTNTASETVLLHRISRPVSGSSK